MNQSEEANRQFIGGLNCCQAVLNTFAPQMGLDENLALKLASGFGGGIGRTGHICGAVSGAIAVLGLRYGNTDPNNSEAKSQMYAIVQEFMEKFKAKHHSILCSDLIGYDLSTDAGHKAAAEAKVFRTICPQLVSDAAQIVESMLES